MRVSAGVLVLVLLSGCGGAKRSADEVFASRYKRAMEDWRAKAQRRGATFDARIAPVPRRERRAFLLKEMNDEATEEETAVGAIDALGVPPKSMERLIAASRETLAFLASSTRAKADAIERRDKAAMARLDAEFERKLPRLQKRMLDERNAVARGAGLREKSQEEILGER